MSDVIVYGGQGNISVEDLSVIEKSEEGRELVKKLKESDPEASEQFNRILT